MARKDVLKPVHIVTAQSLNAGFISPVTTITYADNVTYQINISASTAQGTFAVQTSVDYQVDGTSNTVTNPGNWVTLPLAGGVPYVNAANDTIQIDLNQIPGNAVRLAYTETVSGPSDTADVYITHKQIGG